MPTSALRLAILVASTSFLTAAAASAQDWSRYPPALYAQPANPYPQGAYGPQGAYAPAPYAQRPYAPQPYTQDPYSQAPYAPGAYGPPPYAQAPYAQGPYGQPPYAQASYPDPYADYAAQQRAWRRRPAQNPYQQAYAPPPSAPPPSAPPPNASPLSAPDLGASAPAPPQSVALAHGLVESASAYLGYMRKASAISAGFTDGAGVAKEVRTGAAYEPKQFEEGAIAYAAIVALQEPGFVDGVRQAGGGDPGRMEQIADALLANPASAASFPGADRAAARASAALRRQGDRLLETGTKVKQSAYDVQHAAWSKGDVPDGEARLAGAKTLSATRWAPQREETNTLLKLVLSENGAPAAPGEGAASPVVSRGLALAALAVLGQAGDGAAERLQPLMGEEQGGQCLHMAKLNLFQCLAVAGPHYEDIFCLGQHALMDTAQCVIKASGVAHPMMTAVADPASAPVIAPMQATAVTPAPQDYWAPLGSGGGAGQEQAGGGARR